MPRQVDYFAKVKPNMTGSVPLSPADAETLRTVLAAQAADTQTKLQELLAHVAVSAYKQGWDVGYGNGILDAGYHAA